MGPWLIAGGGGVGDRVFEFTLFRIDDQLTSRQGLRDDVTVLRIDKNLSR
jgi:hypothetical protein